MGDVSLMDIERVAISAQWRAFDKVLSWINCQECKYISKGDLYDAVIEMRPETLDDGENRNG